MVPSGRRCLESSLRIVSIATLVYTVHQFQVRREEEEKGTYLASTGRRTEKQRLVRSKSNRKNLALNRIQIPHTGPKSLSRPLGQRLNRNQLPRWDRLLLRSRYVDLFVTLFAALERPFGEFTLFFGHAPEVQRAFGLDGRTWCLELPASSSPQLDFRSPSLPLPSPSPHPP